MTHLRLGCWNLRVGRRPEVVCNEVEALLDDYGLDALLVQEAAQYVRALRRRLRGHYRVLSGKGSVSRRDSAIIVRVGLLVTRQRVHSLGGLGWERGKGRPGRHHPRHMVSVRVIGGPRLGSVHLPPTPRARRLPGRGAAHAKGVRVLARITRRWTKRGPWLLAGDWNVPPGDLLLRALPGTTHGRGIDHLRAYGLEVGVVTRLNFGTSDHRPRLFTIRSTR